MTIPSDAPGPRLEQPRSLPRAGRRGWGAPVLSAVLLLSGGATRSCSAFATESGTGSGSGTAAESASETEPGSGAGTGSGSGAASAPRISPGVTLAAVHVAAPPVVDGRLDEPDWLSAAPTATFVDATEPRAVVAFTQARALWDDAGLTLGFYAADENEESSDDVGVELRVPGQAGPTVGIELGLTGALTCSSPAGDDCARWPGVAGAVDFDGTLDDPSDDDEEWTAELRIPWRALGLDAPPAGLDLRFYRRDQPRGLARRTLSWGGAESFGRLALQSR